MASFRGQRESALAVSAPILDTHCPRPADGWLPVILLDTVACFDDSLCLMTVVMRQCFHSLLPGSLCPSVSFAQFGTRLNQALSLTRWELQRARAVRAGSY